MKELCKDTNSKKLTGSAALRERNRKILNNADDTLQGLIRGKNKVSEECHKIRERNL